MPWRSRLIASSRSSRSLRISSSRVSSSLRLLLGAQIDAAEPLALGLQLVQPRFRRDGVGQFGAGLELRPARGARRAGARNARPICAASSVLRAAAAITRSSSRARVSRASASASSAARAASAAPRCAASACGERVERRGDRRFRRARPRSSAPRRRSSKIAGSSGTRGDLGVERRQPLLQLRDALLGARDARRPALALGCDVGEPARAHRLLMRRRLRIEPRLGGLAAVLGERGLHVVAPPLERRRVGQAFERVLRRAQLAARTSPCPPRCAPARRRWRKAARRCGRAGAPPPLSALRRMLERLARLAARRGGVGARAAPRRRAPASRVPKISSAFSTRLRAQPSAPAPRRRRGCAAPAAARREAAEPGLALKPSQRQSPPSRVTSRWPAASVGCSAAPSSSLTTPIWRSRRVRFAGPFDEAASGSAPSGSAGSRSPGLARPPEGRRLRVERGVEIVAERRHQRLLVAGRDLERIDQRRELPRSSRGRAARRACAPRPRARRESRSAAS